MGPATKGRTTRRAVLLATILLAALLLLAALAGPALAGQLDVPLWSQHDSRWSGLHLDGSSYTMYGSGCAVTSCAMVAAYFGSDKDPGELCRALGRNGGLDSRGRMYWERVPAAAGGTINYVGRWDYADLARINRQIDAGYPVIAEVRLKGGPHFVVITGREGSTYRINDPGYGDRTTINARYGSPGVAIKGIRVYQGALAESHQDWRFADVAPTHRYYTAIEVLAQAQILCGYLQADGSSRFYPGNPVLRAQAAKLLCGVFDLPVEESLEAPFADLTPDTPDSLYPHDHIAAAAAAGIVQGFLEEGQPATFAPWEELSRAQLLTMVVRAAQNLRPEVLQPAPDIFPGSLGDFDLGHAENLRVAEYNDLLAGLAGFGPEWNPWAPCSRGEVAQVLYNLLTNEAFSRPLTQPEAPLSAALVGQAPYL